MLNCCGLEFAKSADELRQHAAHFHDAHDRQLIGIDDCLDAGFAHQRPSRAKQIEISVAFAKCSDECCRVSVARGLTDNNHQLAALSHGGNHSRHVPLWSAVPWHRFGQSGGKPPHSKEAHKTSNTVLASTRPYDAFCSRNPDPGARLSS